MSATDLLLIRHGETAWNRERRIQGQTDTPLHASGIRQAAAVARRLAAERARWRLGDEPGRAAPLLLTSDLARCRLTAEPIGAALGLVCTPEPRLRERAFGAFEGCTPHDLAREHGAHLDAWRRRDPDLAVGGGESLRSFAARVHALFDDLVARHPARTLLLVTHGGVLDVVHRRVRGTPLQAPRDFEIPNAALNRVRYEAGHWEVLCWADVEHGRDALDDADRS